MQQIKRIKILGVPVDCVDMAQAADWAEAQVETGARAEAVIAVNPEKVIKCRDDPTLLSRVRSAGLLIPDGIGVVVAARWLGLCHLVRVPGAELMPVLCERAARKGYGVFLYGASPDVNREAAKRLSRDYPGLCIAGREDGYLEEARMAELIGRINASRAQILFVALGSPRQELWMERHLGELEHVRVCQGVGGTFDVLAGRVRRAPKVFRDLHLEWFYRLASQPRRLLRQTALPRFAWRVLRERPWPARGVA